MEWRKNAGYIITNSITIGESEIVLGVHETKPNMFVTWECANKNNYFWGHYITDRAAAERDLLERASGARERLDRLTGQNKSNKERDAR